jgi:hypoxanthine phosphoribosyltransferase
MALHEAQQLLDNAECVASADIVQAVISRLAGEIADALAQDFPLVLAVMGGAVVFAGQLLPRLNFPLEFDYLHVTRYRGKTQGGEMIRDKLHDMGAARVWSAVLTNKDNGLDKPARADFIGLDVPNRYVFGCGMDVYGLWRNLPAIYALRDK